MKQIPQNFVNYKSTATFDKQSVPKMFLHLHNTRSGVYGKICVTSGSLKFYGFTQRRGDIEIEKNLTADEFICSPPEYWHKVEFLTDDTTFRVDFYADENSEIVAQNLNERNSPTN